MAWHRVDPAYTVLHPNAAGHSLIASATIQALDGGIRKRY